MYCQTLLNHFFGIPSFRRFLGRILLFFCFLQIFIGGAHAANRFWIAAGASNWNNAANWSAVSGGAGGAGVPAWLDHVNFDNNGLGNCTIDAAVSDTSFAVAAGYTGTISQNANTITVSGAQSFSGGSFLGGSVNMLFAGAFGP
jgi:hypothetical protein